MDSSDEVSNNNTCPRKHGISSWMKNNFGRFGTATNFEEYASSPPEAGDDFLTDYHKNKQDSISPKEHFLTASTEELMCRTNHGGSLSNSFLYDPQLKSGTEQGPSQLAVPALSSLLLESFTDDTSSSTDTTPFVTPQGSPLIPRRKLLENVHNSLSKDIAAQNSRKWLYKGFVAENEEIKPQVCITKKKIKPPGTKIKCNVSNFDINALSPSSW